MPSPFSLLHITDRHRDETSVSRATAGNDTSGIKIASVVGVCGIDSSVIPAGWPLLHKLKMRKTPNIITDPPIVVP